MKITNNILALCLLFGLTSCASFQPYLFCDVHLDTQLPILHPAAFGEHLISNQQVTITSTDHKFEFLAQLEVDKDRLVLVALTPIGQKLFQIIYRKQDLKFERFGIPDAFDPAFLLADISLIYGDERILDRCYSQTSLPHPEIEITKQQRAVIYPEGNKISIIYSRNDRWASDIVFTNSIRSYKIEIKSLSVERL